MPITMDSLTYRHDHPTQHSQRPLLTSQSPILEYPPSHYAGHEAKFDVQVSHRNGLLSTHPNTHVERRVT